MAILDGLPTVSSFFGIDLRTGSMIIAALGIIHPLMYCFTLFMPISYLLMTTWFLVTLYCLFSVFLMIGIEKEELSLIENWLWFTIIFIVIMVFLLLLFAVLFSNQGLRKGVCLIFLALLWYLLTIYFIIVVNSYRQQIGKSEDPTEPPPSLPPNDPSPQNDPPP